MRHQTRISNFETSQRTKRLWRHYPIPRCPPPERYRIWAGASILGGLLCGLASFPALAVQDSHDCLRMNGNAQSAQAAAAAVACLNRNLKEVVRRKKEIEDLLDAADSCRGRIQRKNVKTLSCQVATPLGRTSRPPHRVSPVGAQCGKEWNRFAEEIGVFLGFTCTDFANHKYVKFDANNNLVIKMDGADKDFLKRLRSYFYYSENTQTYFQNFDGCFSYCMRQRFDNTVSRYGLKGGYADLGRKLSKLRDAYEREGLERLYTRLASTCNQVARRWWDVAPDNLARQLVCKTS